MNLLKIIVEKNNVIKTTSLFIIAIGIQRGINFLLAPIYTRILSLEEYGNLSAFMTWCSVFSVVFTLNLSNGSFNKAMSKYENDRARYLSSMTGLLFVSCLIGFLLILAFRYFFCYFSLSFLEIICLFISIYFQMVVFLYCSKIRYEHKAVLTFIVSLCYAITIPIVSLLIFIFICKNEIGIILGYSLSISLLGSSILIKILLSNSKMYYLPYWKYAFKFNFPLIPYYLSSVILGQFDRIMILEYCGKEYTAIYTIAYQLSLVLLIISSGIDSYITPIIYDYLKKGVFFKVKKITWISFYFSVFFIIFILSFTPEIIYIIGDKKYISASYIVPVVVLSTFFTFVNTFVLRLLFFYEIRIIVMVITSLSAILNCYLNFLTLPLYGYQAAAYTTAICYQIVLILNCVVLMFFDKNLFKTINVHFIIKLHLFLYILVYIQTQLLDKILFFRIMFFILIVWGLIKMYKVINSSFPEKIFK
ncbi:oligosaccharide flippase family protein [Succinivibrio sp.]|uniref:lipopolysaccharide biosynthesis protein n=1 Tax=Succinivibrio sp. TaxID=2053619 RepID=UPI0025E438D7|nr:oligosaccharide flippase family protein [Succinivibrio sp.]MBQ9219660.1 oligosaccharide flippase family protein [Succinivibrio sp.]